MKLLFTGDFYISDELQGKDLFDASVVLLFDQADYRVVNLEAPVTAGYSGRTGSSRPAQI